MNIASATTFTGFCGHHDHLLFEPIDKGDLLPTSEQAFLLHYRAVCRELYESRTGPEANKLLSQFSRRNSMRARQWYQERAKAIASSLRIVEASKRECDEILLARDFTRLRGAYIRFRTTPSIACTGFTQPVFAFQGQQVQAFAHYSDAPVNFSFSLLPDGNGGIAVFVWNLEADGPSRRFVQSLMDVKDERKSDALVQYAFDSFSNFAAAPTWWEELPQRAKDTLSMTMLNWTENPVLGIDSGSLIPGTDHFGDWDVESCAWIGGKD